MINRNRTLQPNPYHVNSSCKHNQSTKSFFNLHSFQGHAHNFHDAPPPPTTLHLYTAHSYAFKAWIATMWVKYGCNLETVHTMSRSMWKQFILDVLRRIIWNTNHSDHNARARVRPCLPVLACNACNVRPCLNGLPECASRSSVCETIRNCWQVWLKAWEGCGLEDPRSAN